MVVTSIPAHSRPTSSLSRYHTVLHRFSSINYSVSFFFLLMSLFSKAAAQSSNDDSINIGETGILVVVLICALLVTGCLSLYIRGCSGYDESSITNLSSTGRSTLSIFVVPMGDGRLRRVHGLDKAAIDSFPTFLYSDVKELKVGKGCLECAVCLSEFEDEDNLRLLPKCNHVFHTDCIDRWLASHITCPVCRANLVPNSKQLVIRTTTNEPNQNPSVSAVFESDARDGDDTDTNNNCGCLAQPAEASTAVNESQSTVQGFRSIDVVATENCQEESATINDDDDNPKHLLRSHSTGHSLIRSGEETMAAADNERFRLRLPEDVRQQIVITSKLKRVISSDDLPRVDSSMYGYRSGNTTTTCDQDGIINNGGEGGGSSSSTSSTSCRSKQWFREWWWKTGGDTKPAAGIGNQVVAGTSSSSNTNKAGFVTKVVTAPFEWKGRKLEAEGSRSQIRLPV